MVQAPLQLMKALSSWPGAPRNAESAQRLLEAGHLRMVVVVGFSSRGGEA